jgi:glycerate 2-kinase
VAAHPRVPTLPLVVSGAFGRGLSARAVAAALARGLRAGGVAEADLCPADAGAGEGEWLLGPAFDARMRLARAVVLAEERLEERALRASLTFEVATRARQAGVPTYAVSARNRLGAFDARMLDLQLVLEASTAHALRAAGRELAGLL